MAAQRPIILSGGGLGQLAINDFLIGSLFAINVQALTSAPADGATIFFGTIPAAPTTVAGQRKVFLRQACRMLAAEIYSFSGTAGSNTAWPLSIRKNDTTDTLIQNLSVGTAERIWTNAVINIDFAANDFFEVKSVNPTWPTNPNTTIFGGYCLFVAK